MINITPAQLRKAANTQEKIQDLQKELKQILGASAAAKAEPAAKGPKKRKVSAAGRVAIAAAARARWAKIKGTAAASAKPAKKRRTMSDAAKKVAGPDPPRLAGGPAALSRLPTSDARHRGDR